MINRHKLSLAIVIGIAASVLVAVFFSPLQAIAWHCTHGNHIEFGGARLTLPLFWWPINRESGGKFEIAHAKIAQTNPLIGELSILPLKPDEIKYRDEFLNNWNTLSARFTSSHKESFKPEELRTRDFTLYCIKDKKEDTPIICWSPDISWKIGYGGLPKYGKEAESIISTLEKSP